GKPDEQRHVPEDESTSPGPEHIRHERSDDPQAGERDRADEGQPASAGKSPWYRGRQPPANATGECCPQGKHRGVRSVVGQPGEPDVPEFVQRDKARQLRSQELTPWRIGTGNPARPQRNERVGGRKCQKAGDGERLALKVIPENPATFLRRPS